MERQNEENDHENEVERGPIDENDETAHPYAQEETEETCGNGDRARGTEENQRATQSTLVTRRPRTFEILEGSR